ncbi:MAG: type II secretion system protein [Phycisphaerales bacterium]
MQKGKAFTVVECLVCIGIVAIVLSLVLARLQQVRSRAHEVSDLSRIRQLGLAVVAYSSDFKEMPPVLFSPVYVNPEFQAPWQSVQVGDRLVNGAWFMNGAKFHLLLRPVPTLHEIRALGAKPDGATLTVDGTRTSLVADFYLTDAFYADPEYWTRDKQIGPAQWRPQRLSSVAFPSNKAMLWQPRVYTKPGYEEGFPSCCADQVRSAVEWADGSATNEVVGRLKRGVPNGWHHGNAGGVSPSDEAMPLLGTEFGVLGQDR